LLSEPPLGLRKRKLQGEKEKAAVVFFFPELYKTKESQTERWRMTVIAISSNHPYRVLMVISITGAC